jgi:hypothetical protein
MTTYDIIGWNPINNGDKVLCSVYIKPTLDFLDYCNRAPLKTILVKIVNSKSFHDNKSYFAVIDKSSDIPSYRQNLFNGSGLYILTLLAPWTGYPIENGKIVLEEKVINSIEQQLQEIASPSPIKPDESISNNLKIVEGYENTDKRKEIRLYIVTIIILLIIIGLLYYYY